MTLPQFVRRVLGRRQVERHSEQHEDYVVQDYVERLGADNERLRKEIRGFKRKGYSSSGRYAAGRTIAFLLLIGTMVWVGAAAWRFVNSQGFREGMKAGAEAARH